MGKLALSGGKPIRSKPFPQWPIYNEEERKELNEALESGIWGGYNPKVEEFEREFAHYHDAEYGILGTSGTVTLVVGLNACGIGPGDEVIVPPISFISTVSCVLLAGAIPVFVDVESDTYNIDPEKIEEALSDKTKGIIPVHFAGQPANMDRIKEVSKKHNLKIIEDAAHAHGAEWNGKKVGSFGEFGSFSFQNTKLITSGEGGILITSDPELDEKARSYFNQGRKPQRGWFEHFILGTNYRISAFQAAVLSVQLKRLRQRNITRRKNIEYLGQKLEKIEGIELLKINPKVTFPSYYIFCCKFISEKFDCISKETFFDALGAEGIPKPGFYPFPLYRNPLFKDEKLKSPGYPLNLAEEGRLVDYYNLHLPESEKAVREGFWWMHETFLGTTDDMDDIANAVLKIRENTRELKNIK